VGQQQVGLYLSLAYLANDLSLVNFHEGSFSVLVVLFNQLCLFLAKTDFPVSCQFSWAFSAQIICVV
jgi:hypothetical protein